MNSFHTFHPQAIAFQLGSIGVHWYGIILAFAFISGFCLVIYTSKQKQVSTDHLYNLFLLLAVAGVAAGRLVYVAVEWSYYRQHLAEIFFIWQGGLTLYGVLAAGLITVWLYTRVKKIPFWLMTDVLVVAVPFLQAAGRWGNYFNQELFGQPTNSVTGIPIDVVNRPTGFEQYSYFQPLFLYESVLDVLIFIILLLFFRSGKLKEGRLTLLYFILYPTVRFFLDFLRIAPPSAGPLSLAQWVSLVLIVGAVTIWLIRRTKAESSNNTR